MASHFGEQAFKTKFGKHMGKASSERTVGQNNKKQRKRKNGHSDIKFVKSESELGQQVRNVLSQSKG